MHDPEALSGTPSDPLLFGLSPIEPPSLALMVKPALSNTWCRPTLMAASPIWPPPKAKSRPSPGPNAEASEFPAALILPGRERSGLVSLLHNTAPAGLLARPEPDRALLVEARGPAAGRAGAEPGRARGRPRPRARHDHRRGR